MLICLKQNSPEITHSSFPNGTVLQCEFGKESCHISLYTKPAQGSNKWLVFNFFICKKHLIISSFDQICFSLFFKILFGLTIILNTETMVQKCIISEFIVSLLFDDLHLNFSPEVINTVSSSISDIHAFHSQNVQGSTCHVDLSVKPEIPGNHTICIKAEDQGFVKIKRILYIHVNYVCIFFLKFRNFFIFFFF